MAVFVCSFFNGRKLIHLAKVEARQLLGVALSFLVFVAPVMGMSPSTVSRSYNPSGFNSVTHLHAQSEHEKGTSGFDSFIIEMIDGVATCRNATPTEAPSTVPAPGVEGIPVQGLKPTAGEFLRSGENAVDGLTINFLEFPQLQSDSNRTAVIAAFQRAAAVWTARIKSPVTITMNIEYGLNPAGSNDPFEDGVLGSTGSGRIADHYSSLRSSLISTASNAGELSIYNALPTSAIPTDTGNGSLISISRSLTQVLGFVAPEPNTVVATISFNKEFTFDFNPDDGISPGATDFVAVATHEIGHALGFSSNAGQGSTAPVALLDMFRVRPGATAATFPTAQRIMSIGGEQVYFTSQTFQLGGVGVSELGLSTGGPDPKLGDGDGRQSSHWKADEFTGQYIGIMDPTIAPGQLKVATENDFMALETIGWNLISSTTPPAPRPPAANDNFAGAEVIAGCSGSVNGTNLNSTHEAGEPIHVTGAGTRSVWYQWQAPTTGQVTIDTVGSGYDTVLAVYTGTSVNALAGTRVANNDDIGGTPHNVSSRVNFPASAGTVYRIAVDGFNNAGSGGDMGPIKLNWTQDGCVVSAPTIQLSATSYSVSESSTGASAIITRSGDTSAAATVDYFTSDNSGQTKCEPEPATGLASERCDYQTTVNTVTIPAGQTSVTISIPIVNDVHVEGSETFSFSLKNPVGATLSSPSTATITINDNDTVFTQANPIDTFETYVRQQYLDFLSREPDSGGFAFWMGRLQNCAATPGCDMVRERKMVSAGFFYSNEFLLRKGYFIYRFYGASLARRPTYAEFVVDMASMGQNDAEEEAKRVEFTNRWVTKNDFKALYPDSLSNADFVNQLVDRAGLSLDRQALINQLNAATATRAQIVRQVVESQAAFDKFFKEAFISMQYFGYLRRDPDAGGYDYWFNRLPPTRGEIDANPDLYIYDMVGGFVYSTEYQLRFGNRNY